MTTKRPYGSGTVEPFRGEFRARTPRAPDGKRPVIGTFPTEDQAHAELDNALQLLAEAKVPMGTMTLRAYGPRFLDAREAGGVRDIKSERSRWRLHIATAHFADWPLQNVDKPDIREWLVRLSKTMAADIRANDPKKRAAKTYVRKPRKIGAQSQKHCLNLLRMAFVAAIDDKHCTTNPCDGIEPPPVPKPAFDYLQLKEQLAIERCEEIPEADRLRAMFAWGCGIRQYDQWVMKLADLRLDRKDPDMIILCHKSGPRKPPRRIRVQLFGVALRALKRWLEILPTYCPENERGLVWPLPSGAQRAKSKDYGWGEMRKAAGIRRRVTWHELRDTCASSLLMGWWGRVWTLREVQEMLAHSSSEVTERYAHFAPAALAEAGRDTPGEPIGHQLAINAAPLNDSKPRETKGRATQESNLRPSASEASGFGRDGASLEGLDGQLMAKAVAVLETAARGDEVRFRSLAIELAGDVLEAGRVQQSENQVPASARGAR